MLTPEKYEKARASMQDGSMPEDLRETAARAIDEYERANGLFKASVPVEGGASRAAPASTLREAPSAKAARQEKLASIEKMYPGLADALQLTAPSPVNQLQAELDQETQSFEEMDRRLQVENSLKNLSKRKDLDAPTEFHPPEPPSGGGVFDAVWGKLSAAKRALPDWAGGGTQHYVEPSFEQFQHEMAPVLGDKVASQGANARYREYADAKWIAALRQAQAEGRSIVRDAFRSGKEDLSFAGASLPAEFQRMGQTARAAGIGADEAMTGGVAGTVSKMPGGAAFLGKMAAYGPLGLIGAFGEALGSGNAPSVDELGRSYQTAAREKELEASGSPLAEGAGFAFGSLSPMGIGNVAAAPVEAAVGRGLGKAAGGAAAGFVGGSATSLAADAPNVAFGEESVGDALGHAVRAGGYGMPLGVVGAALGSLVRHESAPRRLETRARNERIGTPFEPDVEAMLARDVREPIVKRLHEREGQLIQSAKPLEDYKNIYAGEKVQFKPAIEAILEAKRGLIQSDGTVASGNVKKMKALDKLLGDLIGVEPQLPEAALPPAFPQRLEQLEKAVDLYGELGTPETYQTDVKNIHEMATPTRPITPQAEEAAAIASERNPLKTLPDLGPFEQSLPNMKECIETGMAGERIRSLHQARLESGNEDIFDITPKEARELGLDVGEGNFARLTPKAGNPRDLANIDKALRDLNKAGTERGKPFPDYDRIKRALHESRDAFKGETADIKLSDKFTLPNGEVLEGYSARNAQHAAASREFGNLKKLLGIPGEHIPEAGDTAALAGLEGQTRGYGRGGRSPEIDAALRQVGGEAGVSGSLEDIAKYGTRADIEKLIRMRKILMAARYGRAKLDPQMQALADRLEDMGSLGALPGEMERSRELPPMADQATLDEIRRVLQP